MDILGIGPLEVLLVLVLALVVLGPQDMVGTARKIGAWLRKIVRSPMWREIMETSREIREIPTTLMRDSGIQEAVAELKDTSMVVRNELGEATSEIASEVRQVNQELASEGETIAAEAGQSGMPPVPPGDWPAVESSTGDTPVAADSAAAGPAAPDQPAPPDQDWIESSGNQPRPPLSPEYPRVIPLGTAEPPQKVGLPPDALPAPESGPDQASG